MSAKSISDREASSGGFARWTRNVASVLVMIASLAALALMVQGKYFQFFRDSIARILELQPSEPAVEESDVLPASVHPEERRYRALAEFLARKYRVSQDVTFDLVTIAHTAGHQIGLDPLLIIAVMAVESKFNPIAESVAGAKGLMQVIPKYHGDKFEEFGGEKLAFDPRINILVGSQILHEYFRRTGSMSTALQMYAGAASDEEAAYAAKVMSEKQRLQQIVKQMQRDARPAKTAAAETVVNRPGAARATP
jgi:hypothetical protein